MGKIVDKTETKIVTLDGVEIIKQVTKVLMPNGKIGRASCRERV